MISKDIIDSYSSKGWVIHPLSAPTDKRPSPGKRPLLGKWNELKKTPENIEPFLNKGCNIGIVCGKASNITVIDFDTELFVKDIQKGVSFKTLASRRTQGRGHLYFKYDPDLAPCKHHDLGIEILSDGNNAVLPPSVHASGDVYKWTNELDPIEIPEQFKENILNLLDIKKKLIDYISQCRPCFRSYWNDSKKIIHGSTARLFVGAFCSELFNKGAGIEEIKMFSKILYKEKYDESRTITEYKGWTNKNAHPWKCINLEKQCIGFVNCTSCTVKTPNNKPFNEVKPNLFQERDISEMINAQLEEQHRQLSCDVPSDHFIAEYLKWMHNITDGYTDYQIMSALWILSAVTQGKVILRLKQETVRPNFWGILIGKSTTSRKSTIVNKARRMFEYSCDVNLPNEDYSIEGYLETLSINPKLNNVRDEAAGLMAKFHKKYNEGIFELECSIYDGQNITKTLSGGKNNNPRIFQVIDPYVTKLYATTPDNFTRYMTIDDFTCGYGFRFLFSYPNYKKDRKNMMMENEEDIKLWGIIGTKVKTLYNFFYEIPVGNYYSFTIDDDAMQYYNNAVIEMEDAANEMNNDIYNSSLGRAQIHILKIAMLLEIGKKELNKPVIRLDSMKTAVSMVQNYFIPSLMDIIDRLQEDVKINQIEKVISVIRRLGGLCPHTKALHDSKLKSKDFNECIQTMVEAKTIEGFKDKATKCTYYRLLNHNHSQNLSNPKNPPSPLITQNIINEEILETSNNLTEYNEDDDTLTRARPTRYPRLPSLRDIEISGISGILGISAESFENIVTEFKRKYDVFNKPDCIEDLDRLKKSMMLNLTVQFDLELEKAERMVNDYCHVRGWV